jgi:hypothetical protein
MPWWGWLIAAGLVVVCATWVTIVVIAGRNVRGLHDDWNAEHQQWRKDHGFGGRR